MANTKIKSIEELAKIIEKIPKEDIENMMNMRQVKLIMDDEARKFLKEALVSEINGYIEVDHSLKKSKANRIKKLINILNQL